MTKSTSTIKTIILYGEEESMQQNIVTDVLGNILKENTKQ